MKETKFYLITDTHYFAPELGCSGPEYDDFMHYEQKCFAETASINRSVIDYLKEAKEADNVLIAGDLSFNGEIESHREFIALLDELRESGKNVYVVTADHDFKYDGDTFAFGENGRYSPEGTKREDLPELYKSFGFGQAIAEDREHLSYVAQIGEGVRLLALNCDFKKKGNHHFKEEQLQWIKEQAQKAREDGQMLFAMNHYPILGGQPLMALIEPMSVRDSHETATFLADNGIHLVFTGHMHNQSINFIETEKG
ncbi:MAG: metallophosphoesterase, partial [Clostridia bacterium]|nr:metallophosphoesterase [Clostridia bacterium]